MPESVLEEEKTSKTFIPKDVPLDAEEQHKIRLQFESEYQVSYEFTQAKRQQALRRLKLYNNQKRDQSKVGDPLLFTVFNTVLSRLYEDRQTSRFEGREEGDEETAENVTAMAKFDHTVMEKDELDYDWDWDAAFFGRGLMLLNDFDRKNMVPVAEVIDPMVFIRDPRATSVNGNQKGVGALRFWGREIGLSISELKENGSYFNLDKLLKESDDKELSKEARQARREAQNLQQVDDKEETLKANYEYQLIEWFTHINGEKYLVTFGNNRRLMVRYQKVKSDGRWPLIDRAIYPMAHDWDGVSIPDLIEDKQRARSVMINLDMKVAISQLYPMYLYNKKKISNEQNLDFEQNKWIPVTGDPNNAVQPLQKSAISNQANLILNILDIAAQKAVAAPEVAQGVQPKQDRTLGETELVAAGSSARHSLSTRIFGWSEKRFWQQWYWLYKKHFKEGIDEKVLRIQGPLAPAWRTLTRENLISRIDPDVFIESMSIVNAERREKFANFSQFASFAMQEPRTNRMFVLRKMGSILGHKRDLLLLMFPPTIDELRSEDENAEINENKLPEVNPMDDDSVHMEIHNKAADTKAKIAHIEAHKEMMLYKKEHPEQFPLAEPMPEFKPVGVAQQEQPRTTAGRGGGGEQPQEQSKEQLL